MTLDISNNVNSAIISGSLGLNRASNNIAQNAFNIAQRSAQSTSSQDPQEFLANAARQQLTSARSLIPKAEAGLTADLVGLTISSVNAQASAKVLGVAGGTVGTILDILA
jgi:hypothetical protein